MARLSLLERSLIPSFELAGRLGKIFNPCEYKRKRNLCVFFLKKPSYDFLIHLEESYPEISKQNFELVVISSFTVDELNGVHERHRLNFWLLSDPAMGVSKKFIDFEEDDNSAALFVVDRRGYVFFRYLAPSEKELPQMDEIIKALEFTESQ